MHKCASVNAMTKQTRQFGERAMLFDVKTHHICGKSARKNHQKHTTWWQKIKTWDTTPLLVPTKSSLKRTFTKKTARHSATCANQFVKMIAKKHTTWWQKNKIASVFAPPFVAPLNVPCATIPNAPNGQFYKNGKGLLTSGQINGTIVISMR